METKLKFESKGHRYYLDEKPLTGVTTIIGILDKPALIQWSANQAIDYIEKNCIKDPEGINGWDKTNWRLIDKKHFDQARKAWITKRDKAGDIGTEVHKVIEEYVKSCIDGKPEFKLHPDPQVNKMTLKFKDWAEENQVKFLLSEQQVYSEKYWYAGTVDLLVEIKGKKYIADIKTARDIYNTNYIQMAGYHIALEELGKVKDLEGYIVINIPKDFKKDGEAKLKEKRLTNTEEFKKAFINCLELYRFINKIK